jgi:hypothetical protein
MKTITGRISGLLNDSAGEVNGVILDNGRRVRFSPDRASRVLAIATVGSQVEVQLPLQNSFGSEIDVDAVCITNLDSQQSATLSVSPTTNSPEVSTGVCPPPGAATPLAPSSAHPFEWPPAKHPALQAWIMRRDVVDEIEQAHDALHRIQTMLAHFEMMKREQFAISEYLDEAKHTYAQALSRCQGRDFEAAREFAAASSGLSRVVDILISRTFQLNADGLKPVSSGTEHVAAYCDERAAHVDLDRVEHLLDRIRRVTRNGTLPSEDRERVERLSLWSASLHGWARCLLENGVTEKAIDFVQAADAAACSAEHLCKECSVTRGKDTQSAAATH